ncbi:glycoside hydrolase family 140 protein [Emticicia sp. BO119]|uniref:glycoside hydrolase family 140 protein n=1 Tax=Emticicia sp. BO119 TaxID=2757768 RepID=UPI0015F11C73|nr:glycoside hydrolase family 140 protein [Emticicia sp. BO119]MBA4853563.1 glycoside hydrolase family 140 protein [Emticicia sp. BO119]
MKSTRPNLFLLLFFIGLNLSAQTFSVSENKRFLMKDGKPFFWLGDTAWELFHRLDRADADYYLKKRASQNYTVIQAVALAEFDGLTVPNPYGDLPLINNDPTKPNETYFKHVDYIIDRAADYGLTIGFLPTWGDKLNKSSWGKGPEVFNMDNAKVYGKWLATRYKNRKNIIWILGGDRQPRENTNDVEVWRAMAAGIVEGIGGNDMALITFHPQPNKEGSSQWFHSDDWFDFNMFQNGHCRDTPIYDNIKGSYDRAVVKPVIDGEPIYEDHPVCFNANDLGTSNAYDVRKYAYLDLFAGAFGHTYGCHDIWQMYSPNREAVNGPHTYWQQALELPGAKQMQHARRLIESRPFLDRVPDQSLIVENNQAPSERIQATRGKDYAFIYSAAGKPFTVNLGKISGSQLNAYWFDPRNGKVQGINKVDNKGSQKFSPPRSGYGQDWILVLDDASKNFPQP